LKIFSVLAFLIPYFWRVRFAVANLHVLVADLQGICVGGLSWCLKNHEEPLQKTMLCLLSLLGFLYQFESLRTTIVSNSGQFTNFRPKGV
jgi:hypothetical protein